jgi:hypothetical protein
MKNKFMSGIFLFAAALVAIPISVRIAMAVLDSIERRRQSLLPPFCGYVWDIKVVRPKYTDPTRVGSRIDFMLRLWGTGEKKTKIKSIVATVTTSVSTGMNMYTRPLLRMNPLRYNYVYHKGVDIPYDVCMYLDDIKPDDIDGDSLVVEVTDTEGNQHLFSKKTGDKAVLVKENER